MMFGDRITFSAILRAESEVHIGALDEVAGQGNIKKLLYDHTDRPLLPASTLKGALRARMPNPGTVFGAPTDCERDASKVSGVVAKLWFGDAPLTQPAETQSYEGRGDPSSPGVFLADHVAIDRKTGAAENNKLYRCEMIASGGRFELSGIWFDGKNIDALEDVLAILVTGVSLGQGTGRGNGRIILEAETLKLKRESIGSEGYNLSEDFDAIQLRALCERLAEKDATIEPRPASRLVSLRLDATAPYISVRSHKSETDGGNKIAQPLQQADGMPLLRAETLVGALREKASWLAELKRARDAHLAEEPVRPDALPCDNRFRRDTRDISLLTPVERLFGVGGWASRLRIRQIMPAEGCSPETVKLTSVSIDRITGASREKFLYSTRAFTAARFDVILAVERLNEDNESDQAALEVFDSLIDYLTAKDSDGLEIGHGTTTGFGWFDVKRMEEAA